MTAAFQRFSGVQESDGTIYLIKIEYCVLLFLLGSENKMNNEEDNDIRQAIFQVPDTEIEGAVVEQTSNWDTVQ